ncbi:flagellar protein G [Halohasta salina]|uniref:flagellar protein G n=1 Tax=Halohasta salina TaxID=2961621 RepID=UPI0020A2D28B|nr:flagellar protein G [Halohasta salina]
MASVSASHLIIFIASLVIAAGVVGTLTTGVDRVSSAIDDRSLDVTQQVRMDMAIISDPSDTPYDTGTNNLTIHVRNTGSQGVPIEASAFDVVLNGQFVGNDNIAVDDANGDSNVWRPGDVVAITITDDSVDTTGDNRLILTVNEDQETFEFTT